MIRTRLQNFGSVHRQGVIDSFVEGRKRRFVLEFVKFSTEFYVAPAGCLHFRQDKIVDDRRQNCSDPQN